LAVFFQAGNPFCYNEDRQQVKNKKVSEIFKKSGFKRASPEERIDKAFSKLDSTHDAIFVFDDEKFVGVVNLYHSTLGRKINPQEKVKRCFYHPPIVTPKTSVVEVARLMVESRLYQLPIIEKDKFKGVIFFEDILKWFKKQILPGVSIEDLIKIKKPEFIDFNSSVDEALHLMINNGQNRLLVTDKNSNLLGILTLYDLRKTITEPRRRLSFLTRAPIKKDLAGQKVKKFYQRSIVSIMATDSVKKAIDLIIKNKVGSLAVFNDDPGQGPAGLVTVRSILSAIASLAKKDGDIKLSKKFGKNNLKLIKKQILRKIERTLKSNTLLANKIESIKLDLKEISKSSPQVRLPLMEITALVRLSSGNKVVWAKVKGRRVSLMIDQVIERIKRLLRKEKKK